MEAQTLSKKVVPKMEAQKLSQKKRSQNGNPKTIEKEVVPKMEAQKLSQKKWFPKSKKSSKNVSPKTVQKKFPKWKHTV